MLFKLCHQISAKKNSIKEILLDLGSKYCCTLSLGALRGAFGGDLGLLCATEGVLGNFSLLDSSGTQNWYKESLVSNSSVHPSGFSGESSYE